MGDGVAVAVGVFVAAGVGVSVGVAVGVGVAAGVGVCVGLSDSGLMCKSMCLSISLPGLSTQETLQAITSSLLFPALVAVNRVPLCPFFGSTRNGYLALRLK